MNVEIIWTGDGSPSLRLPGKQVTYHSANGALDESRHVYLQAGLLYVLSRMQFSNPLRIFEVGFGTGLNALLTFLEANRRGIAIEYETVEPNPLPADIWRNLHYEPFIAESGADLLFDRLHSLPWDSRGEPTGRCGLLKHSCKLQDYKPQFPAHLVYFDAFDPNAQPELWTPDIFGKLAEMMTVEAVMVTYSCKGLVRRTLQSAGFRTEKLPGATGKREMLRAIRLSG